MTFPRTDAQICMMRDVLQKKRFFSQAADFRTGKMKKKKTSRKVLVTFQSLRRLLITEEAKKNPCAKTSQISAVFTFTSVLTQQLCSHLT